MKQKITTSLLVLFSFFASFWSTAQCTVDINATATTITCGDSVTLSAIALGSTPVLQTDFNNNSLGSGWTSSIPVNYANPCGPTLDGTPAAWMGSNVFPRVLTTNPFDVSCGGQVCFDLDFAGDENTTDCEDPDQIDEGVYFQYSIDGGATWVDIFYFEPNATMSGPYYNWANYCFTIPPAAMTLATMFQWNQPNATPGTFDHWGIDNVSIIPALCGPGFSYTWSNPGGGNSNVQTVAPMNTTTYTVTFSDGTVTCDTSITITVNPLIADVTASPMSLNCGDSTNLNAFFTNSSAGSIFDDFDPAEDAAMWDNIQSGTPNTSCGSMTGNAMHFDGTGGERSLTTVPIDATASCSTIDFCLFIGNTGSGGAPCENADAAEDVELQYSIDAGATWTLIQIFDDATWDANNSWQCFNVAIPMAAQTQSTMFRWIQPNFSSCTGCDNWAIDDISIACTPPTLNFVWSNPGTLNDPTIADPTAFPTTAPTTTYTVTITNPATGCSATDSVVLNLANCSCQFNIFTADITPCLAGGTYGISGDFQYILNPGTGTIIVEATNGSGTYTQTINPPFADNTLFNYNITGIPMDGTPVTVTIYFSDETTCTTTLNDTSPDLPTVTAVNGGADYCMGDVVADILVDVTGTAPWTIDYTLDGTAMTATGSASPVSLGNTAGVYVVTLVTDSICSNAAAGTQTIVVNPLPAYTVAGTGPTTCTGTDGFITISGLDAGTAYDVTYNDNGTPIGPTNYVADGNGDIIINGLDIGTHDGFVVQNTATGCSTTIVDVVTLSVITPTISNVQITNVSCNGFTDGMISFDGTDVVSYTVNGGAPVVSTTPVMLNGLAAGTYTIVVSSIHGCTATEVVNVTEPAVLTMTPTVTDASCFGVCDGQVQMVSNGGTMPYTYTWMQGVTGDQNGLGTGICHGTYSVDMVDANGCMVDATYFVDQPPSIDPALTVDTAAGCFPHQVDFQNITASTDVATTLIDFGDGSTASYIGLQPFEHTYEDPGIYTVTITVTSVNGCVYSTTYDDLIQAYNIPIPNFFVNPDFISMLEPSTNLYNQSSGNIQSYEWVIDQGDPATSNSEDVMNVTYPPDAPGLYPVVLHVTNHDGCTDSIVKYVTITNDLTLYAPNTFTPDGDEHNQTWEFHISGIDIYDFDLRIFNRWGEVVWESHDPSVGWDGTYNGKVVETGMYTWVMECADSINDKRYTFNGRVTVLK